MLRVLEPCVSVVTPSCASDSVMGGPDGDFSSGDADVEASCRNSDAKADGADVNVALRDSGMGSGDKSEVRGEPSPTSEGPSGDSAPAKAELSANSGVLSGSKLETSVTQPSKDGGVSVESSEPGKPSPAPSEHLPVTSKLSDLTPPPDKRCPRSSTPELTSCVTPSSKGSATSRTQGSEDLVLQLSESEAEDCDNVDYEDSLLKEDEAENTLKEDPESSSVPASSKSAVSASDSAPVMAPPSVPPQADTPPASMPVSSSSHQSAHAGDDVTEDGAKSPPNPSDPVDLPDDMFESAAALLAADSEDSEEEEMARTQAQEALSYLEHSEGLGDEPEGNGGEQSDEDTEDHREGDGEFGEDEDTSRDVDTDTNDICVEEDTMQGQFSSDAVEDSCDGVDLLQSADVEDATDLMRADAAEESMDGVNDEIERSDVCEIAEVDTVGKEAPKEADAGTIVKEVTDGTNSTSGSDKDEEGVSSVLLGPQLADISNHQEDDPDDPPATRKRSRSKSPQAVAKQRKVSGTEVSSGPAGSKISPRNFIEVKKVQLSEVNQRLLKESNERDRRRLEGAAAAPAATVVNGALKSSLGKKLRRLTREELEALVLEKMCESIASRSVIGDMKRSAEKHVTAAERFQKKITHLQKQVGDLHQVVRKLSAEMKTRRTPAYPVKITRTVGLQVMLAKSVPPLSTIGRGRGPLSSGPVTADTTANVLKSQLSSPNKPGTIRPRVMATLPRSSLLSPNVPMGPGRPPLRPQTRPMAGSPQRVQQTTALGARLPGAAGMPVVRTNLPLGSVPLPQRPSAARSKVLYSPGRLGRPPHILSTPPASAGSAAVVDLTDDDDRRLAPVPQRRTTTTTITNVSRSPGRGMRTAIHPAPFPMTQPNPNANTVQLLPPPPELKVTRRANGIVLSWTMDLTPRHATVVSYHLFAYQQPKAAVNLRTNPWKKVGDVKALPLPMACTLTQFQEGHKYHFAVRAEDNFRRRGPFSNPSSIALIGTT